MDARTIKLLSDISVTIMREQEGAKVHSGAEWAALRLRIDEAIRDDMRAARPTVQTQSHAVLWRSESGKHGWAVSQTPIVGGPAMLTEEGAINEAKKLVRERGWAPLDPPNGGLKVEWKIPVDTAPEPVEMRDDEEEEEEDDRPQIDWRSDHYFAFFEGQRLTLLGIGDGSWWWHTDNASGKAEDADHAKELVANLVGARP